MTISALPSAPLITDPPDIFDTKASAHVASLSTLVTEINAAISAVNMTKWISGTTYAIGDVTWSPATFYAYRRKTAGAGTTDPSADATNWISIASASAGANSDITSMTALTAINRTGGTAIKGTNTNDNAAAGNIGESVSSVIPSTAAVSLTSGSFYNITSVLLAAGDWDVSGNIQFVPAASTSITTLAGAVSSTSATFHPYNKFITRSSAFVPGNGQVMVNSISTFRISIGSDTTFYLVAYADFTASTLTAYGQIYARRAR